MNNDLEAIKKFSFRQFLQKSTIELEMILDRDLTKEEHTAIEHTKKIQSCKHEKSAVKKWFRHNGVEYGMKQCEDCGIRFGNQMNLTTHQNAPHGDVRKHLQRDVSNQITYSVYTETARKIITPPPQPTQKKKKTENKRSKEYEKYMSSEAWKQKRLLVLKRDNYTCQARMNGCTMKAQHVHHVSYKFLGDEPLWDLQSVCVNCHRRIHN